MNHLTTIEVFQFVDGSLAAEDRERIVTHVDLCSHCRQEIEFERVLVRNARSAPLVRPSIGFREKVLAVAAPPVKKNLLQVILNNLGNILAMAMVLTAVWFASTTTNSSGGTKQPTMFSDAVKTYVDYYAKAKNFVAAKQTQLVGEPAKNPRPQNENVVYLTILSLVILVVVDRFVMRKLKWIRR